MILFVCFVKNLEQKKKKKKQNKQTNKFKELTMSALI
jgi:hypothetical protein